MLIVAAIRVHIISCPVYCFGSLTLFLALTSSGLPTIWAIELFSSAFLMNIRIARRKMNIPAMMSRLIPILIVPPYTVSY